MTDKIKAEDINSFDIKTNWKDRPEPDHPPAVFIPKECVMFDHCLCGFCQMAARGWI